MHIGRVENANLHLVAPSDWDNSKGECGKLPVRVEDGEFGKQFTSAWLPTADEIERINQGAAVHLTIVGAGHPPVMLSVGEAPDETV